MTSFIVALASLLSLSPWRAATKCLYSRQEGCDLHCNDDLALSWAGTEQFVIFSFIVSPGNWLMWKGRWNEPFILHIQADDSGKKKKKIWSSRSTWVIFLWRLSTKHWKTDFMQFLACPPLRQTVHISIIKAWVDNGITTAVYDKCVLNYNVLFCKHSVYIWFESPRLLWLSVLCFISLQNDTCCMYTSQNAVRGSIRLTSKLIL